LIKTIRRLYSECAASISISSGRLLKSSSAAASRARLRELNLSQPAVTHQVQELERRFKVSLVERLGKRVYLTQAGEELIEHARNLLEDDARA